MQIIDGYCNEPNIFADDIGEYNTAIWGTRDCVLPAGERLGYELISNNEIKIKDGVFSTQGRRGVIKKGTTESCIIENGTQAENRNDLIVIEYAKDSSTLVESHTLKVIKGTPGEAATDPDVVTGDIQAGDVLHQMPLYRVKLEGLNVVAVERLFSVGNNAIGKEFDPDKDYEIGDLTLQYNKAWKFKVKHLAGAWDESQMEETDVLTELAAQNKNFDTLSEKIESTDITQERLVGKFYGKNVYEKVIDRYINIPASTNFQTFSIPHGIENFESIISINIMVDGYTLPFLRDDGYLTTYIFIVTNTNIVLYNRTDWNNNFRITLRYTKSK